MGVIQQAAPEPAERHQVEQLEVVSPAAAVVVGHHEPPALRAVPHRLAVLEGHLPGPRTPRPRGHDATLARTRTRTVNAGQPPPQNFWPGARFTYRPPQREHRATLGSLVCNRRRSRSDKPPQIPWFS